MESAHDESDGVGGHLLLVRGVVDQGVEERGALKVPKTPEREEVRGYGINEKKTFTFNWSNI